MNECLFQCKTKSYPLKVTGCKKRVASFWGSTRFLIKFNENVGFSLSNAKS